MAERRLPCSVKDDRGALRHGELLIARAWRPDLEINPDAEFTIVILQQPPADTPAPARNVVVCAPAAPVRLPAAVHEAAVAYAPSAPPAPLQLPPAAIESFAAGRLIAPHPLAVTAAHIFRNREPDIEALIRALDAAPQVTQRYWEEAERVLAWPDEPARAARPERLRTRLRSLLDRADGELPDGSAQRLRRLADGEAPSAVYDAPDALAEEIAFVRCLTEDRNSADQLAAMRSYLERAAVDASNGELALQQPHRFDSLRATFEMFRDAYARAYVRRHAEYDQAIDRMHASLEAAQAAARALGRLNTLRALGSPVGQRALEAYERLRGQRACSVGALDTMLREQPRSPECAITLADAPPAKEAARALQELHGALATQQARLASEAVRRILARGGARVDQFLQIAQAADSAGLAQVLDDELLAFLRDLLAEPVVPTPEALDLFEQLARAYPVIDEAQVDDVVRTLRQLLTEAIARQAADAERPGAFRFASPPRP